MDSDGFLPLNHGRNLLLLVAGVMVVAGLAAVLATVRAKSLPGRKPS
jgi:hypothetical protein